MITAKTHDKRTLLIAGPTASGKSGVALELTKRFNGTIINADAMQVYRELRVLSSRPGQAEEDLVPHRLYGEINASERFSSGKWLELATNAINDVWAAGRLPILVGGTGLYFKLLEEGVAQVPDIPPAVRVRVQQIYESEGSEGMRACLPSSHEPYGDPQRLIREVEVYEATGRLLAEWQQDSVTTPLDNVKVLRTYLLPDRAELYARCDQRFQGMIDEGAEEEVCALLALNLDPDLPAMKAIGMREISAYLSGDLSLEQAIADAQTQTRRYAKRQMTWYRGQMQHWPAYDPDKAVEAVCQQVSELISR